MGGMGGVCWENCVTDASTIEQYQLTSLLLPGKEVRLVLMPQELRSLPVDIDDIDDRIPSRRHI